jgi:hypothetical protein
MAAVKRKRRNYKAYSQCERCVVQRCSGIGECARLELEAFVAGTVHECLEFEPDWETRLCA